MTNGYGLYAVSLSDGSKKIELLCNSVDDARKVFARYHEIPLKTVIGYPYIRIFPKGMI